MAILTQEKTLPTTRSIPDKCIRWTKRIGVLGFLFFLIKGLLWIIVPAILFYFGAK